MITKYTDDENLTGCSISKNDQEEECKLFLDNGENFVGYWTTKELKVLADFINSVVEKIDGISDKR